MKRRMKEKFLIRIMDFIMSFLHCKSCFHLESNSERGGKWVEDVEENDALREIIKMENNTFYYFCMNVFLISIVDKLKSYALSESSSFILKTLNDDYISFTHSRIACRWRRHHRNFQFVN